MLIIKMKNPKKLTLLHKMRLLIVTAVFMLTSSGLALVNLSPVDGATLEELRTQSAALQAQINENNRQAQSLAQEAGSLKRTLAELDIQIGQTNTQIELISNKIQQLEVELQNAQAELERQKGLLKSSMRALYKRGGASTVELLVGSDSFSDFINDQEYLERLKTGIQESTEKIIQLKLQIQTQQDEQKVLLAQQEAAKVSISASRAERADLLAKTQGDEARYRAYSRELVEQQKVINRELLRLSRVVNTGGTGGYPWPNAICVATGSVSGDCSSGYPIYEWYVESKSNRRDDWGYYYRNCTSYVAWVSDQHGLSVPGLGNGGSWAANAWKHNLPTGNVPKTGAFAVFSSGGFGHVAYVEAVSGGEVLISEYNYVADGIYSERWLPSSLVSKFVYTPWSQ